jgi:hypothetical protein
MFDEHSNFGISNVVSPPSPDTTGTRLSVTSGDGANFPTPPFNATVWQANTLPKTSNAEIVRVTAKSGDVFTISRNQESTPARAIVAGDQIAATITKKTLTDIEGYVGANDIFVTVGSSGADHTTDGVADDVQIQAAITAVNAAGGGTVIIKSGSYSISSTIALRSNITIDIQNGATLTQASTGQVFQGTGTAGTPLTNIRIRGGKLVGPTTGSGNTCIAFTFVNYSYIEDVDMSASMLCCVSFTNCSYNHITGCQIHDASLHGLRLKASTFNRIIDCDVYNIALPIGTGVGQGIYLFDGSSDNNTIEYCRVNSIAQSGIRIEGSQNIVSNCQIGTVGRSAIKEEITGSTNPVGGIKRNQMVGNTVTDTNGENGGHTSLWLQGSGSLAEHNIMYGSGTYDKNASAIVVNGRRCVVANNNIIGFNMGIEAEHPEVAIIGNNIRFCYSRGIYLSALSTGTNYSSIHEHSSVTGNVVMNNSLTTVAAQPGILVSAVGAGNTARYNIISSNNCSDNQTKCSTTTSGASSGQKVVTVAKTSEFTAGAAQLVTPSWGFIEGMNITLTNGGTTENAVIATVDSETQITLVSNLSNTYPNGSTVIGRASQSYGVAFSATSSGTVDSNIVSNNICHGNATGGVSLAPDSNVVNANNITA